MILIVIVEVVIELVFECVTVIFICGIVTPFFNMLFFLVD